MIFVSQYGHIFIYWLVFSYSFCRISLIWYITLNKMLFKKYIRYVHSGKKKKPFWIDADDDSFLWRHFLSLVSGIAFFLDEWEVFCSLGQESRHCLRLASGWEPLGKQPPGSLFLVYRRNIRASMFSVLKSYSSPLNHLLLPRGIDIVSSHWQMSRFNSAWNSASLPSPVQKRLYCDSFQWVDALPEVLPTRSVHSGFSAFPPTAWIVFPYC